MHITFYGAAQTVTGSQHLISVNGKQILLDCGLFQGRRAETYARNHRFAFEPGQVDAVLLSHAHIDHCGNLPNLVKQGFAGPVYGTPATSHLTDLLTQDSGHIHESDAAYLNKKLARRGQPLIQPLYTIKDARKASGHLVDQAYDRPFTVAPGITATFVEAGHILGSAAVVLDLEEDGRKVRLMFSGDIGRRGLPILRDPVLPRDIDNLIMECTYGDTSHDPPETAYHALRAVLRRTFDRGGKVIIPAFAVGRTQTLVYDLHQMIDRGEISRVPVFVDSPLAINVTDVFQRHLDCFDEEAQAFMRRDPHGQALGFDLLNYTRSVEESKAINYRKGPLVIISASGMAETGRILHHLRNNLADRRNTILITSWMAPHTLGRRLAEGQSSVKIFGQKHRVRSEVVSIDGLSAHAGEEFLVQYALAASRTARSIYLVHGEPDAAAALRHKLSDAGVSQVRYPEQGERVQL
jgi:metallo-beta-lactamase family protein